MCAIPIICLGVKGLRWNIRSAPLQLFINRFKWQFRGTSRNAFCHFNKGIKLNNRIIFQRISAKCFVFRQNVNPLVKRCHATFQKIWPQKGCKLWKICTVRFLLNHNVLQQLKIFKKSQFAWFSARGLILSWVLSYQFSVWQSPINRHSVCTDHDDNVASEKRGEVICQNCSTTEQDLTTTEV